VLTGVGTILADDPQMNVRGLDSETGPARQPLRVVLDSRLRTPPDADILQGGNVLLVCQQADPGPLEALLNAGAVVLELPGANGRPDLAFLMQELARRSINEVHVEAGATLNGALLEAGLVDEWVAYLAPLVMGDQARGLFALPALEEMAGRKGFAWRDSRMLGPDLRLTLRPA
jgi:diaminohydroxyphosphoribosylaminopyrimidine deaminase/5-amino-6-(5-phosphoribosylamino)uracil reductase